MTLSAGHLFSLISHEWLDLFDAIIGRSRPCMHCISKTVELKPLVPALVCRWWMLIVKSVVNSGLELAVIWRSPRNSSSIDTVDVAERYHARNRSPNWEP